MEIKFDRNCTVNYDYQRLLSAQVERVTRKIGNSFSDIKWTIYDPEKPPEFDPLDYMKLRVNKTFNHPVFDVPNANKYGFCCIDTREIYISIRTFEGGAVIVGLDDRVSPHGLGFLTEVIIHELAHLGARTTNHESPKFKSVLDSYVKRYKGL